MSSEQQNSQAAPSGAAPAGDTLDLVTVRAESNNGVNVWSTQVTTPAHQYDEHPFVRAHMEADARAQLAAVPEAAGLPVAVTVDRWTLNLGSGDDESGDDVPDCAHGVSYAVPCDRCRNLSGEGRNES